MDAENSIDNDCVNLPVSTSKDRPFISNVCIERIL